MEQDILTSKEAGTSLQKRLKALQSYFCGILNFIQVLLKPCRRYHLRLMDRILLCFFL